MDSSNQFEVRKNQKGFVMVDIGVNQSCPLLREEALNLAAWLVAIADPMGKEFQPLLLEILSR
jgi:hypothetical protein